LSTRLREKEERIQHILECLALDSSGGTPIVVEGKKDIGSLRSLGVEGEIVTAKSGKRLLDVVSEVEESGAREIILLADFDRRGRELTSRLKQHLEKAKITANTSFWRELSSLVGKEVKDVEGLAAYLGTLKKKIYGDL
jgi:2,5-diamino-6-(ribosylamino)-4(3H)-pyrimidinone 5'-phosphate reductase